MKREESKTGRVQKKDIEKMAAKEEPVREKVRELELNIDEGSAIKIEVEGVKEKTSTRKLAKAAVTHNAPVASRSPVASRNDRIKASSPGVTKKNEKERTNSRVLSKKEVKANHEEESSSRTVIILIFAASFAAIAYFQADLVEGVLGFNLKTMIHGEDVSRKISSVQPSSKNVESTPAVQDGKVILGGLDLSMEVFIDGRRIDYVGKPIKIPLNRQVSVAVKKTGHQSYVTKVRLSRQQNSIVVNVPELERSRLGLLSTSQNYTAGSKLVYEEAGEMVERPLPFKDMQIPEGVYQAKVVNPILGTEKNVEFTIEENKKHFLE
jgi:hypothetical protein